MDTVLTLLRRLLKQDPGEARFLQRRQAQTRTKGTGELGHWIAVVHEDVLPWQHANHASVMTDCSWSKNTLNS